MNGIQTPHMLLGLAEEEWKAIPSFNGYEASSHGRIRKSEGLRVIAQHYCKKHYLRVNICKLTVHVHGLVCSAFHGPRPANKECCHLDGTRTNNVPDNLRWVTHHGNCRHTIMHGTSQRGEKNTNSKLTYEAVAEARLTFTGKRNELRDLAKKNGVNSYTMRKALTGGTWPGVKTPPVPLPLIDRVRRSTISKAASDLLAALQEIDRRTELLIHQNTGRWNTSAEHDQRTIGVLEGNREIARAVIAVATNSTPGATP